MKNNSISTILKNYFKPVASTLILVSIVSLNPAYSQTQEPMFSPSELHTSDKESIRTAKENKVSLKLGKPVTAFSASPLTGLAPLTVQFTDESTNDPTSWFWVLPGTDSSIYYSQNPKVIYSDTGSYNATLIVTNIDGKDTLQFNNYIAIKEYNGIAEENPFIRNLSIYPNPVEDKTIIKGFSDDKHEIQLNIYDRIGRKESIIITKVSGEFEFILNTSEFKPGVFLLEFIADNGERQVKKFVRQ